MGWVYYDLCIYWKKKINENNLGRSEFDDKIKNILINLFVIVNIVS